MIKTFLILLLSLFTIKISAQDGNQLVKPEIVYQFSSQNTLKLGVKFEIEENWHIYWRNPGDTGIKTKLDWKLPENVIVKDEFWPYPERLEIAGLVNFGYEDEVLLYSEFEIPDNLYGKNFSVSVNLDWLVCKIECLPGGTSLNASLDPLNNQFAKLFDEWENKLPLTPTFNYSATRTDSSSILVIDDPESIFHNVTEIYYYPYDAGVYDYETPQNININENGFTLEIFQGQFVSEFPSAFKGLLIAVDNNGNIKSYEIDTLFSDITYENNAEQSVLLILLFAFIGGIILNFMPCVLPVISLKILGFVHDAQNNKKQILQNGLIFSAGVIAAFWVLTAVLLVLKAGGESLGWGFQLQEPRFVIFLLFLFFALALNQFGVMEIGASATSLDSGKKRSKIIGTFFSGVLATVVATPCTAPFMGTALGYTLTQPAYITVLVFSFLGLGMASPYLLFSTFPGWIKILPKPGDWMTKFKQVMGFILMGTALWLLWVLSLQKGSDAVLILLAGMLVMALGLWIYGSWAKISSTRRTRIIAGVLGLGIMYAGMIYSGQTALSIETNLPGTTVSNSDGINWEQYSDKYLKELLDEDNPVFIDFTAAWCLTCQVNKKVAFSDSDVIGAFKEKGITPLIADWTNRNDEITAALARFDRNSVPLYVYYHNGKRTVLPELLTPEIVLNSIKTN